MDDKEYYIALMSVLNQACKNAVTGFGDIGKLNDTCIETRKRVMPYVTAHELRELCK